MAGYHGHQWSHKQRNTFALCQKLFRISVEHKNAGKIFSRRWAERKLWRKTKLMRFVLPFQWHQNIFSVNVRVLMIFLYPCTLETNGVHAEHFWCMFSFALSKYDANNPTYLLDLSTSVRVVPSLSHLHGSSLFMRNTGIKHITQHTKQEVMWMTTERDEKKVEPEKKLVWKKFLSRVVRLTLRCGYIHLPELFRWLPDIYMYVNVWELVFLR